jgi:serine-type D-Ala-D-Ala carboxypeptidase/endopeptidase
MTHVARHDKAGGNRVGLAWHIVKGKKGDVFTHSGGTGGYRTFAAFVNETGTGVVVMTNSTESVDDIGFHLLDPESPLRNMKPSITRILKKTINSQGIDAAVTQFYELKNTKEAEYDFSEGPLNTLGYSYLEKDVKTALAIFKLNVEMYPNSSNVYDSYGEALMKDGQKELAIESYKKSVELNPGNIAGIAALEHMGVKVEAQQALELQAATLEKYVGTYELAPGFNIVVTREGNHLFEQATNQGKFEIFASNEKEFYLKVVNAQVIFNVNDQGVTESMTLVQNGQRVPGKKIK